MDMETPTGDIKQVFRTELAGRPLVVEIGQLAQQANGSALVRYGDTVILATATASKEPRQGIDFFPLRVDWEERLYAAGRIPGSFFRREGKPSERAILSGRLTDRPLRPLFPKGYRNDVQIIVTTLSYDDDCSPEIAGIIGASVALGISDIPWNGPVGAVEVGLLDGELVINPTAAQREHSRLDLTVAGTKDAINMVEAGAHEVPEATILDAIFRGHEEIRRLVAFQEEIIARCGKPKAEPVLYEPDPAVAVAVRTRYTERLRAAINHPDKQAREAAVDEVKKTALAELLQEFPEAEMDIKHVLDDVLKEIVRRQILEEGVRPDGRRPDEIRPIHVEVGLLPRAHGSGLFQRGQTQVLTVASLGAPGDRQMLDTLGQIEEFKRYMHHYNFPPYSTGEVAPLRAPSRREIGHGALAERALVPVLPDELEFPYTIRLVSEVLSSNGSTSMASTCGSTLALMDAGVPIRAPVAGVAMGLIKEGDRFAVLTDIQGIEDHLGDMDFKVAGTREGVTAIQMDIKIAGVDRAVLETALEQARVGRLFILDKMLAVIDKPRPELSPYAPRIIIMQIPVEKIREVIGPGGRMVNRIADECGVKIDIEDDGKVYIAAQTQQGGEKAKEWIEQIVADVEVGSVYLGKVTRLMTFGAFVEILPGKEGLVHVSRLAPQRVPKVEDMVRPGDTVLVKVVEIDDLGRVNLSRKDAIEEQPEKKHMEQLSGPRAHDFDEPVPVGGTGERRGPAGRNGRPGGGPGGMGGPRGRRRR
ncbi:polyribonucleotide nucleotidyltransferase [Thermaerobacter litoralis]